MLYLLWPLIGILLTLFTYYFCKMYDEESYYKRKGVVYLGNGMVKLFYKIMKGLSVTEQISEQYWKVKNSKQKFGIGTEFSSINFFITDLDLIKQIFVKKFDHFVDRRITVTKSGPFMSRMLISRKGDDWRNLRSKMFHAFTTGKLRKMFSHFDHSGKLLIKYFESQSSKSMIIDLTQGYSKYTMDVVASIAFGIDSKAFDQIEASMFEKMGNKLPGQLNITTMMKLLILHLSPKLGDMLGLSIFSIEAQDFFAKVIKTVIKHRQETGEQRNDFLQLMLDAREGRLQIDEGESLDTFESEGMIRLKKQDVLRNKISLELDDDDIVAQSILFIVGGYDTTLSLHLFVAYCLALYPDLQEKVYQELHKELDKNNDQLTYDLVNRLKYMDMFIQETSRLYPAAPSTERTCTKEFIIPDTEIKIEKGNLIEIPIFSFQRDPEYFPNPEKFDPERFSLQNKNNIKPYSFMTFGHGPRNCIGMRLALVEVKVAIAHILLNFKLEPSNKTIIPIRFAETKLIKPEDGMFLTLVPRN